MNHNGSNIESRLWAVADELRANSKLKSSESSVPVLGLVFLRFADHNSAPCSPAVGDIIVITDEAHHSQYDTLAMNMRAALPNASFLAFTGTPLIIGEEKTRQVFGEYISVYDFQQSVADGATVPLYYENRIPELQLVNENLNEDMERLLEAAELDEAQEKKLERNYVPTLP